MNADKKAGKTVKVRQTGSASRRIHTQRETLIGLKLNKIGREAELRRYAGDPRHDRQGRPSRRSGGEIADETSRTLRPARRPQDAKAHRARHRLRQRQDRRPRRQGPDRAFRRAHQRLRGRPDAAASPSAQARLQEHDVRAQAQRSESRPHPGGDRRQALDAAAKIDAAALVKAGLLRRAKDGVRLLGAGEIKAKVTLSVYGASKSAVAAVEKAGGTVEILAPKAETSEQAA